MPRDLVGFPETVVDADGAILLRAAEIIEECGWWDGADNIVKGVCAIMAMSDSSHGLSVMDIARLGRRLGVVSIAAWNDAQPNAEAVTSHLRACAVQS